MGHCGTRFGCDDSEVYLYWGSGEDQGDGEDQRSLGVDMITISKEEYFNLKCSDLKLMLLEQGGVDNWDWYGDSLNPDGEPSFLELKKDLHKEIFGTVV